MQTKVKKVVIVRPTTCRHCGKKVRIMCDSNNNPIAVEAETSNGVGFFDPSKGHKPHASSCTEYRQYKHGGKQKTNAKEVRS